MSAAHRIGKGARLPWILAAEGDWTRAIEDYEQSLTLDPNNTGAMEMLRWLRPLAEDSSRSARWNGRRRAGSESLSAEPPARSVPARAAVPPAVSQTLEPASLLGIEERPGFLP